MFAQGEKSPSSPFCDVCHSCSRLMKTGLKVSTPSSAGASRIRPRRILSDEFDENHPPSSPSKFTSVRHIRARTPLEDYDPNSQDSGYGVSEDSKSPAGFRFVEPSRLAPRRLDSSELPKRNLLETSFCSVSPVRSPSGDGSFDQVFDALPVDEVMDLPSGLDSLLSGKILDNKFSGCQHTKFHSNALRPKNSIRRRCMSELDVVRGKRPLGEWTPGVEQEVKRARAEVSPQKKGTLFQYGFTKVSPSAPRLLSPSVELARMDSEADIKMALTRSESRCDLTGDFSRPCALPLMPGKHQDLKTISADTLAQLIHGKFLDRIASFKIIDCRYPYEYDGGHIKGAVNLYTPEQVRAELMRAGSPPLTAGPTPHSDKRDILVFHCEFSSERGPKLSRYLRAEDRRGNQYPWLKYPELYLLGGGYSAFYQRHANLCEPCAYKPMTHPAHASDLKHFRAKSKTWGGSKVTRSLSRLF